MHWLSRSLFLSLFLLSFSAFSQTFIPIGAACFISDSQGRVVVAKEMLNNRYALPGGYIKHKESATDAAKRETFEETGIAVDVLGELTNLRGTIIFDCRAQEPIPVYEINSSRANLPAWKAPHFAKEIAAVHLLRPNTELMVKSRFPEQTTLFPELLKKNHPSKLDANNDFSKLSSIFFIWSSDFNFKFQSAVKAIPPVLSNAIDTLLRYSSGLGDIGLYFLLVPLALATGGIKRCSQLLLSVVLSVVLVTFGKLFFAIPRPMHIFPELLLTNELNGFSFPSGHTTTAFTAWGIVYLWFRHVSKSTIYIWIVPGILTALSRIYLGAHHLIDVLGGAALGALVVYATLFISRRGWLLKSKLWTILGLLITPLPVLALQPIFIYCAIACFAFGAILTMYESSDIELSTGFNEVAFFVSLIGMSLISLAFYGMQFISSDSIDILIGHSLCIVLLIIWLAVITPRVSSA